MKPEDTDHIENSRIIMTTPNDKLPKILLTIGIGGTIIAANHDMVYNDDDDVIGVKVECDDGSFSYFTNDCVHQTFSDYYNLTADTMLSYDQLKAKFQSECDWEDEQIPWLKFDESGMPDPKSETKDAVISWLNKKIEYDDPEYEMILDDIPTEYSHGIYLFNELNRADREELGLRWGDAGGPASSVPCAVTSATNDHLNEVLAARGLAYKFV